MKRLLIFLLLATCVQASEKVYATFDVSASKQTTLALDVSGIVNKIFVDVGSAVKAGDILLELENSVQKNDLALAQNDLKIAQVNLQRANSNYERYLKVKNVIDEFKLDSFKFDSLSAEVAYEKAKTVVEAKKTLLEKTYLKSPYDGVIANKKIEVGDGVSGATLTPLFELINASGRKLVLAVDEKYSKVIKIGQIFTYQVDGESKTYSGKISKIYPSVDSKSRAIKAEVLGGSFKPGIFGDGYIEVR